MKSSSTNAESVELKPTTDNGGAPAPSYLDSQRALVEGDVQKKITPWTNPGSVAAELFPGSAATKALSSTRLQKQQCPSSPSDGSMARERGGLILVASLLNKIPNLGGEGEVCTCQWRRGQWSSAHSYH